MFLEVFSPSLLSLRSGVFPEASTTTWAWSFIKKWNKYVFGLACDLHFVVKRARVFTFQKICGSLELTYVIFKTDFTDHCSRLFFCLPTLHSWLTNSNLSAGMEVTPCIWYNGQVWESHLRKKKTKTRFLMVGIFFRSVPCMLERGTNWTLATLQHTSNVLGSFTPGTTVNFPGSRSLNFGSLQDTTQILG